MAGCALEVAARRALVSEFWSRRSFANVHVALAGALGRLVYRAALTVPGRSGRDFRVRSSRCSSRSHPQVKAVVLGVDIVPGVIVGCCRATVLDDRSSGLPSRRSLVVLAREAARVPQDQSQIHPAWGDLGESYFLLGNWHLLWYGVIVVALLFRAAVMSRAAFLLT
jgi:hypothetical protein